MVMGLLALLLILAGSLAAAYYAGLRAATERYARRVDILEAERDSRIIPGSVPPQGGIRLRSLRVGRSPRRSPNQ